VQHTVWLGKDNEVALELHSSGANLSSDQYDAITNLVIRLRPVNGGADVLLDNAAKPGVLAWDADRKVVIEGGLFSVAPVVPAGLYRARVIAYSTDQPLGVVFADFEDYTVQVRT
jgi:hypothetical protein